MAAFAASLTGSFRKQVEAIERAQKRAATTTMRRSTTTLKNAVRRELKRARLAGVEKAVQDRVYPARGIASDPAGTVYSKAIYKRPGGLVDLLTVFREGAEIVARGVFLLIGKRKRGKVELRGKKLARAQRVQIVPRLTGLDAAYERAAATLQPNYEREFERQLSREASK